MTKTRKLHIKQRQKHCRACAELSRELDSERTAREKAEDMAAAFEHLAQELIDEAIMMDDDIYEPEVVNGDLYMIPLPKTSCILAIYRRELMAGLSDELIMKCLKRGKYIQRHRIQDKRLREREARLREKGVMEL